MSGDRLTQEHPDARSFEERVFARFDALDSRFDRMETRFENFESRLEKLEARPYDAEPMWERALAEIAETSASCANLPSG